MIKSHRKKFWILIFSIDFIITTIPLWILYEFKGNETHLFEFLQSSKDIININSVGIAIDLKELLLMSFLITPLVAVFGFILGRINNADKLKKTPASFILKIADLLPFKHRKSLIQEISDMRLEYYEALSEKRFFRARCIVAFYYAGLSWSAVMWISDKAKEAIGIIPKQN